MLKSLIALALCLPTFAQEPPKEQKPDPKLVQAALQRIDKAYESNQAGECVEAIRAAATLDDAELTQAVARGLHNKHREVRVAAVETLRFSKQPKAFEDLESFWKRDREALHKDQELAATTLRAIGQFGNPRAIELLAHDPFATPLYACIKARLLGLGNIRKKESLDKLMGMLRKVGEQTQQDYMADVRLALLRLTGQDLGMDPDQWFTWYENNQDKIEIAKLATPMPELDQFAWDSFWSPIPLELPVPPGSKGGK